MGSEMCIRDRNISGDPITNASIEIKNNSNETVNISQTDVNGWVWWVELTEYIRNSSTTDYRNPYNITISATGYKTKYLKVDMTESKIIETVLEQE